MFRSTFVVTVALVALGFLAFVSTSPSSGQTGDAALFTLAGEARLVDGQDRWSIASVREAQIVFSTDAGRLTEQVKLSIPLLDGISHTIVEPNFERRAEDDLTLRGRLAGGGDVVVTFRKGFVSGLIYGPAGVYEIVPRGDRHYLVELNQDLYPECGGAITDEKTADPVRSSDANISTVDSGDRIDVIVVYTTATKNVVGGDAQAQVLAQQAIDSTNTAYLNSKIRQRVRLVHSQEFVYTETTNANTDLVNLRGNATIQALRETHKADLVAALGEISGACGIGYLLNVNGGVPGNGYTFTARSCAVGNLSFAHELGHNMGSHHNPENAGTPIFPYGFGHYVNGNYRTVMSYDAPCTSGCTRRPYFSNPSVLFNNLPTGIENARDNARMINMTADWVAGYRYSGSSIMMTNYSGGEWLPRTVARNITWTSDNISGNVRIEISRDESTTWETLVASTPNDGSEPVAAGGRATRRGRVRVVSLDSPHVSDSSVTNVSIR